MPQLAKNNGTRPAAPVKAKVPPAAPAHTHGQTKFTYALKQHSVERRGAGWFVAETVPSIPGNKPAWRGPFQSVENACCAIARSLALELTDRHTRRVASHRIDKADPLHGLDPKSTF